MQPLIVLFTSWFVVATVYSASDLDASFLDQNSVDFLDDSSISLNLLEDPRIQGTNSLVQSADSDVAIITAQDPANEFLLNDGELIDNDDILGNSDFSTTLKTPISLTSLGDDGDNLWSDDNLRSDPTDWNILGSNQAFSDLDLASCAGDSNEQWLNKLRTRDDGTLCPAPFEGQLPPDLNNLGESLAEKVGESLAQKVKKLPWYERHIVYYDNPLLYFLKDETKCRPDHPYHLYCEFKSNDSRYWLAGNLINFWYRRCRGGELSLGETL